MEEHIDRFRPVPFYFINTTASDALSKDAIFNTMENLKNKGFGGCIVFNKPPDGFSHEDYLTEKWFNLIGYFANAGQDLALQIWINDGFDFPPGDAGGRIQQINPSLKQRRFTKADSGDVITTEVDWGFPAFEEPESSELFIKLVYEEYKKRLGDFFGNGITGFFSDADCRRFGPVAGEAARGVTYFPAAQNFFERFQNKYDYNLEPLMSTLIDVETGMDNIDTPEIIQARHDYWEFCGVLYAQWFNNNYQWCSQNNLKYSFHSSDSGPLHRQACPRSSIYTEGRFHNLSKLCDYPGTDHELLAINGGIHLYEGFTSPSKIWGTAVNPEQTTLLSSSYGDLRAKYTSSVAVLNGKTRALCEAFAATNWGCRPEDLRRISAWQIMQGINFIVPHAYHHRLHKSTKFFAPPDFSSYGSLDCAVKEFNDWLAEMCMHASRGIPITPIAVLDPTPYIWQGKSPDRDAIFKICDFLNHQPHGYLIVDETSFPQNMDRFKILILPNINVPEEFTQKFVDNGGIVINNNELSEIEKLLVQDIQVNADGELQFMRRKLDDTNEILLVANIENDKPVTGKVVFSDREWDLNLSPGEIIVLDSSKPETSQKTVDSKIDITNKHQISFNDNLNVKWTNPNILPLSYWRDETGDVCNSFSGDGVKTFTWDTTENLPQLSLLVPDAVPREMITVDDAPLGDSRNIQVFADNYREYELPVGHQPGTHNIRLESAQKIMRFNDIYLIGQFDVNLSCSDIHASEIELRNIYNLRVLLPKQMEIHLGPRRNQLEYRSWAEQGHPFYSGTTTYISKIELPEEKTTAVLSLPCVECVASVVCDGINIGKRIWSPYEFDLNEFSGKCTIEISVKATLANQLEQYLAPAGLLSAPVLKIY